MICKIQTYKQVIKRFNKQKTSRINKNVIRKTKYISYREQRTPKLNRIIWLTKLTQMNYKRKTHNGKMRLICANTKREWLTRIIRINLLKHRQS